MPPDSFLILTLRYNILMQRASRKTSKEFTLDLSPFEPAEGRLGTTANNVATFEKSEDEKIPSNKKSERLRDWRLLAAAKTFLHEANVRNTKDTGPHRTRICYAARAHHADTITLKLSTDTKDSFASFGGLQTCASVWSCPICAPRIAYKRGQEIGVAIDWADKNGYTPIMMTLTASHKIYHGLSDFRARFSDSYREMLKHGTYKRLRKKLGAKYIIKAIEVTRTYDNGWHYHYHILLFVPNDILRSDKFDLNAWRNDASRVWRSVLKHNGLHASDERGVHVAAHNNIKEHYLSKLGLTDDDTTDARHELSGSKNKAGRHIWSILEKASQGVASDAAAYVEYVEAMAGQKWITWTPGFKKVVGLIEDNDEDETLDLTETEPKTEPWMNLSDDMFVAVRRLNRQHHVLECASDTRSKVAVLDLLMRLRVEYEQVRQERVSKLVSKYYRALDEYEYLQLSLSVRFPGEHLNEKGWSESDVWLSPEAKELLRLRDRVMRLRDKLRYYEFYVDGVK